MGEHLGKLHRGAPKDQNLPTRPQDRSGRWLVSRRFFWAQARSGRSGPGRAAGQWGGCSLRT